MGGVYGETSLHHSSCTHVHMYTCTHTYMYLYMSMILGGLLKC